MFYGEDDSAFQNLPPKTIVEVLSRAGLKGKQSARLVCRRWRWILDNPDARLVCFKQTNGKMTEDSIQCLLKSELYIDHLVLKDLKVTWPVMTCSLNQFPLIREITLKSGNSDETMMTILQYGCQQTESLTLNDYCFSHVGLDILSPVLSGVRWNQMNKLSLIVIADASPGIEFPRVNSLKNSQENNVDAIELIFKEARIPNLRVLSVDLFLSGEAELPTGIRKLMSSFATFLEHHSRTLKELQLEIYLVIVRANPNISAPLFTAEQRRSFAGDLKLECLDISTTHVGALVHLVPPCVWGSENLTKLTWRPICANSWLNSNPPSATAKPIQSLIHRNRSTLTNVTTTFVEGGIDVDPFEISWLESCFPLRELTITNCDKFLSVELQLPSVRKLDIGTIENFKSIENMSTWISQSFQNLETVQFSVCFTDVFNRNRQFDWIQNLLLLPKLGEIRFQFTYWFQDLRLYFTGPKLIREYCNDKAGLMFSGKMQKRRGGQDCLLPSGPCLIKILATQN